MLQDVAGECDAGGEGYKVSYDTAKAKYKMNVTPVD
jgi:hypothetical protein